MTLEFLDSTQDSRQLRFGFHETIKPIGRLDALTSLRFFTALWVFLFHIHIRWPLHLGSAPEAFLRVGAFGMSFFFILSGFILAYRYQSDILQNRFQYSRYLITRFGRIYPNYVFVLIITLPLIDWTTAPVRGAIGPDLAQTALYVVSAAALILSATILIQGYFYSHFQFWANGGAWSLSVEWFCYLLLPIIIKACASLTPRQCMILFFGLAIGSSIFGATALLTNTAMPSVYAHPAIRLPEFIMGVLAFKMFRDHGLTFDRPFALIVGLVTYSVVAGHVPGNYIVHNFFIAPCIGFIIISAVSSTRFQNALTHPILIYLGETSYAFYMFQLFILLLFDKFVPKDANAFVVLFVGLLATQTGASLMHHFLETPARKWITNPDASPFSRILKPTA